MTSILLLIVVAALLGVIFRHGGNFRQAWTEATGFVVGLYTTHVSHNLSHALTWAGKHWLPLLILIVSIVIIITQFVMPMMQPPEEALHWGANTLHDKCGGVVILHILQDGEQYVPGRLEAYSPRDAGKKIPLLAAGADPERCMRSFTLTQ